MSEFDLDGFIGEAAEHYAAKHPRAAEGAGRKMESAFARLKRDYEVRDRIERNSNPKLTVRDGNQIWTPRG